MLEEFKAFAIRGNIVDLAVAVIIGTAFGKIVSSLVDTMFMPIIGIFLGGLDFTSLSVSVGTISLQYGKFIQAVIDFTIIALVIFLALRALNRFQKSQKQEKAPSPSEEVLLLREIRDSLKK